MDQFGARLKHLRKRKELTQQQMADALGMTVRAYQHYENEGRSPTLRTAEKIAELLDVTLDELSVRYCSTGSQVTA